MSIIPNGNKKHLVATLLLLLTITLTLTSCFAGLLDWQYLLPNNYRVSRVNDDAIIFSKITQLNPQLSDLKLDRFILSFCYNDAYIGLKRIPLDEVSRGVFFEIQKYNDSDEEFCLVDEDDGNIIYGPYVAEYYLVDAFNDSIYGPYSKEEYEAKCNELNVGSMCEWINTDSKPEGAH